MAFLLLAPLVQAGEPETRPLESSIAFPGGYWNWVLVSNRIVTDANHPQFGFHFIYVNEIGKNAERKRERYPNGTKFVMVFHEIQKTATGFVPGKRTRVSVMEKNVKGFPETGGWGFAAFVGEGLERKAVNGAKDCWSCHAPKDTTDFTLHTKFVE